MSGGESYLNFAVDRGNHYPTSGGNSYAVAENTLSEGGILNLVEGHNLTLKRGNDREVGGSFLRDGHSRSFIYSFTSTLVATGLAVEEGSNEAHQEGDGLNSHVHGDICSADGNETNETSSTQRQGAYIKQRYQGGANGGSTHSDEEGPAQTQVNTEDSRLSNTEQGRGS